MDTIFKWLRDKGPNAGLNLKNLTLKVVMLLALGSAYRVQSLSLIKLNNIKLNNDGMEITITDRIKTSRPGSKQPKAFFPFFNDEVLCIAKTTQAFIGRTQPLRGNEQTLLISFRRPHKKVGAQTISRWLKETMRAAGINKEFTAHSTRHAATSKASERNLDINIIKSAACWSQNSQVFAKFYQRPIQSIEKNFAETVFDN